MIFNIIVEKNNIFNMIFFPLAVRICQQLKTCGFEVTSGEYVAEDGYINVIFGAHSNPLFWRTTADEEDIFVNCEPLYDPDWRLSNLEYVKLIGESRVLEIYENNKKWSRDPQIFVLPPLFDSISNKIQPEFIDNNERNILFIGSMNAKRRVFLERLKDEFAAVIYGFGIFGTELQQIIARSSFFLNLNYYDRALFNKYRFALCLGSDSVYVGEIGRLTDDTDLYLASTLPMLKNEVSPRDIIDFMNDPVAVSTCLKAQHRAASLFANLFVIYLNSAVRKWT